MKLKTLIFILLPVVFSCSNKGTVENVNDLNGYWQITKAINSDGKKVEYPVNEDYDYFQIKDKKGFHKKVHWQPMDKFLVNAIDEKVSVVAKNEQTVLHFESKFGKRDEILQSLSPKGMTIKTTNDAEFYYKKVEDTLVGKNGEAN